MKLNSSILRLNLIKSRILNFSPKVLIEIISGFLILLFLYTSINKLIALDSFIVAMYNQPLPTWSKPILVWAVPSIEILISIALIFNRLRKLGMYASFLLMLSFTIYIGLILINFFDRVPCSCGGVIKKLTWNQHMLFNLFFLALSIIGIGLLKDYKKEAA